MGILHAHSATLPSHSYTKEFNARVQGRSHQQQHYLGQVGTLQCALPTDRRATAHAPVPRPLVCFVAQTLVVTLPRVLLVGPSGVGKSHIAAALALRLIEQGIRARFFSATELLQHLAV